MYHPVLFATKFRLLNPFWISKKCENLVKNKISNNLPLEFELQRNHSPIKCYLNYTSQNELILIPKNPIRAVAPGQVKHFFFKIYLYGAKIT